MIDMFSSQAPYATSPFGLPDGAAQFPLMQQLMQQQLQQQQQQPFQPQSFGQQLQPQGFLGNLLKQYGAPIGGAIGGAFGNQGLGQGIGGLAGQLGSFLPFQAAPQFQQPFQQQPFQPQGFGQQFQPQGFFGDLLKQYGAPIGSAIGGAFGNQGLGQSIGGLAGQLGNFLPFQSSPQFQQQPFAPIPPTNLPIQFSQQPGIC